MNRLAFLSTVIAGRLIVSAAAGQSEARPPLPRFRDVTAQSRVEFTCRGNPTSQKYLIETMPGGVAVLDYDGDGFLDIYLVNGAALRDPHPADLPPDKSDPGFWNRLFRNNTDGTFSDVTEKAGVRGHSFGMGVATGDFDNDGRQDLYVTNFGRNILYHNNGDGTFADVTEEAGVSGGGWSSSACFVDFDRDGLLDLAVSRYLHWNFDNNPICGPRQRRGYCHPEQFKPVTHLLYHNRGDGTFADVSEKSGFGMAPGYGLGVALNDYDADGWPDILVANDNVPEQMFRNRGNGTFEEAGLLAGLAYDEDGRTFSGMGADFADYNNDGWPDVFIGTLANEKYALFFNKNGFFKYETATSGVGAITALHSGWGLKSIDYDNDGWKDLFVAQGHVMDTIEFESPNLRYMEPLLMMRNKAGTFEDVSHLSGEVFKSPRAARGVAFGDLNNDGAMDAVVNVLNGPALVLANDGASGNHWLLVNAIGTASNRDGIGAKIRLVSASGAEQYGIVSAGGSYQSSSDKRVHFGLGKDRTVTLLEITWPSGKVQKLEKVSADQIVTVKER